MSQMNMHMTPQLDALIARFMRLRSIPTKSEAIRVALRESVERLERGAAAPDFTTWLGTASRAPLNPHPRFKSSAELWK